jgi:Ca-activated chloride channel family protein
MQLAEHGGGIAKFLTSNPEEGDISTALDHILEYWQQPVYAGLRIMMMHPRVSVPGRESGHDNMHSYVDIGDLPAGRTVWVCGKLLGEPSDPKLMALFGGGMMETQRVETIPLEGSYLKSLYGTSKLLGLEFLIHSRYSGNDLKSQLRRLGYDPNEVLYKNKQSSLYPENNQVNEIESLRNFIVEESLNYGIASSETAFIAVYHKAGKRVEATVLVPNALPEGWDSKFGIDACLAAPLPSMPSGIMANSKLNASINRKMAKIPPASSRFVAEDFEIICHIDLTPGELMVLSGPPLFVNAVAVLLDTSKDAKGLNDLASYMIKNIHVEFPDGTSKDVDTGLKLLIFISDMVSPRASVSLPDLIKMHGMRPLNVVVHNESVKIVLVDPNGAWISNAPKMKVTIGYIQTI